MDPVRRDRLAGVLLGTALGHALGLPAEGMSARAVARRFGAVGRFRLLGATGFVSDDTEQSALVAGALVEAPGDLDRAVRSLLRQLLGWFARLPWGVGRATIRACLRIALGRRVTGVRSAGNGAAMRSSVVGVFFADDPARRRAWARALAEVTHVDPRAVAGAVFVAEVAALASLAPATADRSSLIERACAAIVEPEVGAAVDRALALVRSGAATDEASRACGTSGYVVATVGFAAYLFARWGDDPMRAWAEGIGQGGDADSIAAILGAWLGALRGEAGLPAPLIARIHDGPFGPTHLRRLAEALDRAADGVGRPIPRYSAAGALLRNLALVPVILGHGLRRLVPF